MEERERERGRRVGGSACVTRQNNGGGGGRSRARGRRGGWALSKIVKLNKRSAAGKIGRNAITPLPVQRANIPLLP